MCVCVCVCVALVMRHATRMRHIVICDLPRSANLIKDKIFEKKVIEHKMCILIFSTTFVWNISHYEKN